MKLARTIIFPARLVLSFVVLLVLHIRWHLRTASLPRRGAMLFALLTGMLGIAGMLAFASGAHAIYGPVTGGTGAEIVSVDNASDEQGNASTTDADISTDGRYVVFQTRATNFFEDDGETQKEREAAEPPGTLREGGLFRYDRATGALQIVASGSLVVSEGPEAGKLLLRGAENPSVSAEGRYVAFSTAQPLVSQDKNENIDVYVRDMEKAGSEPGAYTLVSAQNGSEEPAIYAPRTPRLPGNEPGSEVWPNTSISADGRYVVFSTTEQESDLPDGIAVNTPPEQLFVRDLLTKTTTLITRTEVGREPGPRCGAGGASAGGEPACGAIGPATISADGSTISWAGTDAPAQTRFLPGEPENASEPYYLWRRWQEPDAQTRRVTGIADPDDPECHEGEGVTQSQTETGPCFGPLSEQESTLASIALSSPGLSANGYTVAFLAGAALRPNITKSRGLDVFLTSMLPGVSRKAGTRELTLGVNSGNPGSTPSIESLALSPDGSTIAFTTSRDEFVLPEPDPVGAFRAVATMADLYVIHLAENTLERAVVNYEGTDPNGSVLNDPTLTQDGSTVAFASSASNLIFGDGNQAADAFTATLQAPAGIAPPSAEVNAFQSGFSLSSSSTPELGLNVKRGRAGEEVLLVETPAAGKLTAQAKGSVPGKAPKSSKAKKRRSAAVLLAGASGSVSAEGTTTLHLRLASKYRQVLKRAGKLKASVVVLFKPSGSGEALSGEASVTFYATAGKSKSPRKSASKVKSKSQVDKG